MKESFVFIFRQTGKKLSQEEDKRGTEEVRAWALQQIADGRDLEPRILGEESDRVGQVSAEDFGAQVIALNFIKAKDFSEAVEIAKSHPGHRYGISIEVRLWKDPRQQQVAAP
jgi:hypothetical protein